MMFRKTKKLLPLLIFVGGLFGADSLRNNKDTQELPPITWDGVCPKNTGECPKSFQGTPPLILISLDGFRPDYLKRGFTSTISKIAECGAKADFMYPVFPSKTFPNHYTIVTGVYPSSHGIIDNKIYDPVKRKLFRVGTSEMSKPYWYEKDPIWVTAEKEGKTTASFFWFGSDVKISGVRPTYYKKYNSKISFEARVDQVLEWLDLPPALRPVFITLYVNEPDHEEHKYGTNSEKVNEALGKVDQMVTRLLSGLQMRNITHCVNLIIVSDHGMSDIDCSRVTNIRNYINVSKMYSTLGPFGRIRPKGRRNATAVADVISKLRCQSEHMRVYPKEQLPVRMHYANNARIEPIILDVQSNWTVVRFSVQQGTGICTGGAHGYDNLFPNMRAIFLAYGPSFRRNITFAPFINTEIYELLTELIDITPNPNNGTRGSLHHILKTPRLLQPQNEPEGPAIGDVPADDKEYNFRMYAAHCPCTQRIKQANTEDTKRKNSDHLPFGIPFNKEDNSSLRLLYNEDYVISFDLKYRMPIWTAFTLNRKRDASNTEDICWTGDARIPASDAAKCVDYTNPIVKKQYILQRPLYPPGFSNYSMKYQAAYITNSIPKSTNHTNILEKKLNEILGKWADQEGQLNVMMGPAFDLLATGIRPDIGRILRTHETTGPLLVPTHIFTVVTWCLEKGSRIRDCHPSELVAQGFLLPNKLFPLNCESGGKIIENNVARIVDIETLTGLSFYTGLPIYDAIRLRTMMPFRSVS